MHNKYIHDLQKQHIIVRLIHDIIWKIDENGYIWYCSPKMRISCEDTVLFVSNVKQLIEIKNFYDENVFSSYIMCFKVFSADYGVAKRLTILKVNKYCLERDKCICVLHTEWYILQRW